MGPGAQPQKLREFHNFSFQQCVLSGDRSDQCKFISARGHKSCNKFGHHMPMVMHMGVGGRGYCKEKLFRYGRKPAGGGKFFFAPYIAVRGF